MTDRGGGVSDGGAEEDRAEEEGAGEEDTGPAEVDHGRRQQHGEQTVRPQGHQETGPAAAANQGRNGEDAVALCRDPSSRHLDG